MALNIKDPLVDELAGALAEKLGMSKTGAVRYALQSQLAQLATASDDTLDAALQMMETEIWPLTRAAAPITKAMREQILGYGEAGV